MNKYKVTIDAEVFGASEEDAAARLCALMERDSENIIALYSVEIGDEIGARPYAILIGNEVQSGCYMSYGAACRQALRLIEGLHGKVCMDGYYDAVDPPGNDPLNYWNEWVDGTPEYQVTIRPVHVFGVP